MIKTKKNIKNMKNTTTKKQRIRSKIDELLRQNKKFITWDMIDICPHWIDKNLCVNYKLLSYEGHVVFKYMKELDIKFIRYSDNKINYILPIGILRK